MNFSSVADGRVAVWFTRVLTTYTADQTVDIGNFDLADVPLVSPGPESIVALPTTFQWNKRAAVPGDSYQFELFDPYGSSDFITPMLGYVDSYTMNSLPAGFTTNQPYGWTVWVNSPDGGYGLSFYYNPVAFSNGSLTPVQFLSTRAQRNSVDMRENPDWRIAP